MSRFARPAMALALLLAATSWAQAQSFDSVKRSPEAGGSVSGKVTKVGALEVTVNKNGIDEQVPVNTIEYIQFAGEPSDLSFGRISARNGRYEDALETLSKINTAELSNDVLRGDVDFYKALCAAKLALAGAGSVPDAGKQMYSFEQKYGTGSYHYLEASEILGDLFVALGRYDQAEKYYDRLSKPSWPDYKVRSGVLVGRALQAQGKHAEAIARFDQVLQINAPTPEAEKQKLAATLGKAVSIASSDNGNVDQALKMVLDVIKQADPENAILHGRAYNALGNCYLKAGKSKDALLAFLHTDVLYNSNPEAHAEALAHLSKLWDQAGQADRGRQAASLLKSRYPGSTWAKQ